MESKEEIFWKRIEELKERNKDRYDYSLIDKYYTTEQKIPIICKIHKEIFHQKLSHHLNNFEGCILCKRDKNKNKFIRKGKDKHGDRFDYSEVIFDGTRHPKVKLKCNICGTKFEVSTSYHIHSDNGGCPTCALKIIGKKSQKVDWSDLDNVSKLKDLFEVQGKSFEEIGKSFGISGHQVSVVVKKFGFIKNNNHELEEKDFIKTCLDSKLTIHEISEKLNYTKANLYLKLKKYNIKLPERSEISIDQDDIVNFIKSGYYIKDIAKSKGIGESQLRTFLDKNNISPINILKSEKEKYSPLFNYLTKVEFLSSSASCRILNLKSSYKYSIFYNSDDKKLTTLSEFKQYILDNFSQKYLNDILIRKGLEDLKFTKGERLVFEYLKSLGISFNSQVRCNELKGKFNSWSVIVDFTIDSYKGKTYWIEYNGVQHYKYVDYFYTSNYFFEEQLRRDQSVRDYCKMKEIILIEIPYILDTYDKVSKFLTKTIIENVDPKTLIDYDKLYK